MRKRLHHFLMRPFYLSEEEITKYDGCDHTYQIGQQHGADTIAGVFNPHRSEINCHQAQKACGGGNVCHDSGPVFVRFHIVIYVQILRQEMRSLIAYPRVRASTPTVYSFRCTAK